MGTLERARGPPKAAPVPIKHQAGGVSNMKGDESMSAKEMARLAEWLEKNGHTSEEVVECLKFIAGASAPASDFQKK